MLRKLIHKFWSRVLGIPMPQLRIPRLKVGERIDEKIRQKTQAKAAWVTDWDVTEEVDEHMAHLGNSSWWPAKEESFDYINDVEPAPAWADVL